MNNEKIDKGSPFSFTMRAAVPHHVMVRAVSNEMVVFNMETEFFYGLDDVGNRMWKLLTTSDTIQDAYNILLTEYDADPDTLRADLKALIGQLSENGLLELVK